MRQPILNNCQGPYYVQLPHSDGGKGIGPVVVLQPGINLVETKQLAEMRKNKGVDTLFKTKVPVSLSSEANPRNFGKPMLEAVGKELDDVAPFAKLSLEEASGIVIQTNDTDLLSDWLKGLKPSDSLVKVINDRIKEVTSGIETSG